MSRRFVKLTRPAIRALQHGSIMEHGIIFSRLHNGDGVYRVAVMIDGKRVHRVIRKGVGGNDPQTGGGLHLAGPQQVSE